MKYDGVDEIGTTYLPDKITDLCDGNSHEIRGKLFVSNAMHLSSTKVKKYFP